MSQLARLGQATNPCLGRPRGSIARVLQSALRLAGTEAVITWRQPRARHRPGAPVGAYPRVPSAIRPQHGPWMPGAPGSGTGPDRGVARLANRCGGGLLALLGPLADPDRSVPRAVRSWRRGGPRCRSTADHDNQGEADHEQRAALLTTARRLPTFGLKGGRGALSGDDQRSGLMALGRDRVGPAGGRPAWTRTGSARALALAPVVV